MKRIYAQIFNIPSDIFEFIYDIFELYEIRGRVGNSDGIVFEVRTKEANHTIPHIHAQYGEYQISIAIMDGTILSGNLPIKKQRKAMEPSEDILTRSWQVVSSQQWNELTKQWVITTLKAPADIITQDVIDKLGFEAETRY